MIEFDVALTDYGLTLESLILGWRLRQKLEPRARIYCSTFFFFLAAASFFGGTVHGFLIGRPSGALNVVWMLSLISIGWVALETWSVAGLYYARPEWTRRIRQFAIITFVIYLVVIFTVSQEFKIAIADYLPPTLFLLLSLLISYPRLKGRVLPGIVGILLTLAAAIQQQLQFGISALHLSFNALYHVIQAVALYLIFVTFRRSFDRK
jgi:hypothetical protein